MQAVSERVLACVYAAIDEANEDRQDLPPVRKALETPIQGEGSELDSLSLITLLVGLEERLEQDFGVTVIVNDDRAFEREPSPFESVRTLVEYAEELLREAHSPA